jgi:uncharacterized cupin superfamily protein
MSDAKRKPAVILKAGEIPSRTFNHPWNELSEISGSMLGRLAGLRRTGVNLGRVAPGKESFTPHAHRCEEEWIYVLSGRALLIDEGVEHEIGPGDFVAFPAPSTTHHLRNPFDVEVTYLMGGENAEFDIVDFPQQKRVLIRHGDEVHFVDAAALQLMRYDSGG